MLQLSPAQMQQLQDLSLHAFEDRTLAHLRTYFPSHCAMLGDAQMRAVIRLGLHRAATHGLTFECCVRTYIEFMCLLGSEFDSDPLLPWAAELLNDSSSVDQVARGDRFYDRAHAYIDSIRPDYRLPDGQPTTARFVGELRWVMQTEDIALTGSDLVGFQARFGQRLNEVFPAKCRAVGAAALQTAIASSVQRAHALGIRGERGLGLVCALMFVLGSALDRDPLLPWVAQALAPADGDSVGGDDEKVRVERLARQGVSTLRRWWAQPHG